MKHVMNRMNEQFRCWNGSLLKAQGLEKALIALSTIVFFLTDMEHSYGCGSCGEVQEKSYSFLVRGTGTNTSILMSDDFPWEPDPETIEATIIRAIFDDKGRLGSLISSDGIIGRASGSIPNGTPIPKSDITVSGKRLSVSVSSTDMFGPPTGWFVSIQWKAKPKNMFTNRCPAGSGDLSNDGGPNGGPNVRWNPGVSDAGASVSDISLTSANPDNSLFTPSALKFSSNASGVVTILNGNQLRQIKTTDTLTDVVITSPTSYELRFYHSADSGTVGGSGLYEPTGVPYTVWKIEQPDSSTINRIRLTQTTDGTAQVNEYVWTPAANQWGLATGNGARMETESNTIVGNVRTATFLITDGSGMVVSKRVETYVTFGVGERLTEEVIDPQGAALTTTWSYYGPSTDSNSTQLQQVVHPSGSWERYEYDSQARKSKVIASFLDSALGAAEASCHVTEYDYTPVDASDSGTLEPTVPRQTIVKLLGQEISRSYLVLNGNERREIQCQTPGALWNDPNNLIKLTKVYTNGVFAGDVQSVKNSDGTLTLYTYSQNGSQKTTTVKSGQPNAEETDIVDGTVIVTVVNSSGNQLSQTITDIASGLLLTSATTTQMDGFGRPTRVEYNDGTYETMVYGCCGLDSKTDREGITTSYVYDDLKRVIATTHAGITTLNTYDAEGKTLTTIRKGSDNSQITTNVSTYDLAGRQISSQNALNQITTDSKIIDGNGHTIKTTTFPDGTTQIETSAQDGSPLGVSGTAVHPLKYTYGVDVDGRYTQTIRLGDNGSETEWAKTYTDMVGRPYKTVFADGSASQSFFNNKNQMVKQIDADSITTLFQYNPKGDQEYRAIDMDRNGVIDFGGTDPITRTHREITAAHGKTIERVTTTVWTTEGANTTSDVNIQEGGTDGLDTWNITFDAVSHTRTLFNGNGSRTLITTNPDGSTSTSQFQNDLLMSTETGNPEIGNPLSLTYSYDAYHRVSVVRDGRGQKTVNTYNDLDQLVSVTVSANGVADQTTSYRYDFQGHKIQETLPDGKIVLYTYFDTGESKKTSGARTYTSENGYDPQGRPKTLLAGTGATTWNYNSARGFLTSKVYVDGSGPSYSYTPGGQLKTRNWARNVNTTYSYNNGNHLSGINYSDSTPEVNYTYNRQGKRASASGEIETLNSTYHDSGLPLTESHVGGPLDGVTVKNTYDTLLRRTNLSASNSQSSILNSSFLYDGASRLSTVTDGAYAITYTYLPNSYLVDTINFQKNGNTVMTAKKQYDGFSRLTQISIMSNIEPRTSNSFSYQYNQANQRTRVTLADGSYWVYQYNDAGEVISGKKYFADNTPVPGSQFDYTFDNIGNRLTAKTNGKDSMYTPNALNQYTQKTVPGTISIVGTAAQDATVTVNNESVVRTGEYFYKELNVDNSTSAVYQSVDVVGVKNNVGPNGEDAVMEDKGNIFLPQTPEAFIYDADGNLTSDGRWNYSWDAENRLIGMESVTSVPATAKKKLEFVYDYQGRRISKKVYNWNGSAYILASTTKFVYDGWNLIAELDGSGNLLRSYTWGTDLSGSVQGAGGVGGLLIVKDIATNSTYFYCHDGNGNVSFLVNATDGSIAAEYEYGPFGELVQATGPMAKTNPFRFSTKYTDDETGLVYYGYRYEKDARWPSREPLGENAGENLYAFVSNDSINYYDNLGLEKQFSGNPAELYLNWLLRGSNGGLSPDAIEIIKNNADYKYFKSTFLKQKAKRYLHCSDSGQFKATYPNNPPGSFVPFSGYSGKFQFTFKASCSYSCGGRIPERCCSCKVKCDLNNNVSKLYTFDKGPNMNPINEGTFSKVIPNYRINQDFTDTVDLDIDLK